MRKLLSGIVLLSVCACNLEYNAPKIEYEMVADSVLTDTQSLWLNIFFDSIRGDFDFSGKKVAFLAGYHRIPISEYLSDKGITKYPNARGYLYILTDSEKEETGGYDAAISKDIKRLIPHEKVVKLIKKYCCPIKLRRSKKVWLGR